MTGRRRNNTVFDSGYCETRLQELFEPNGARVSPEQLGQLVSLVKLLTDWNTTLNLTAIRDLDDILVLHIMDSAVISPLLRGENIADVGTGAGFPGLVLAILEPGRRFTLIDSVAKKLSFVRTAMVELRIMNVSIVNGRCENLRPEPLFDTVVSRAFAPLDRFVSLCTRLIAPAGLFIAMKANLDESELKDIPKSVKIESIISLKVPGLSAKRQAVLLAPSC